MSYPDPRVPFLHMGQASLNAFLEVALLLPIGESSMDALSMAWSSCDILFGYPWRASALMNCEPFGIYSTIFDQSRISACGQGGKFTLQIPKVTSDETFLIYEKNTGGAKDSTISYSDR